MRLIPTITITLLCAASTTVAHSQEREWSWDMTDEDAFLVFGTPNTDDVGISFWCKIGSGKIKVVVPSTSVKNGTSEAKLNLTANGRSFDFGGKVENSDNETVFMIEAEAVSDNPVFAEMEKAEVLSVAAAGHTSKYPLIEANFADLRQVCRKR